MKSSSHWRAYESTFEIYFSLRGPEYEIDQAPEQPGGTRRVLPTEAHAGEGKASGGEGRRRA